jgi:hypothetical protein
MHGMVDQIFPCGLNGIGEPEIRNSESLAAPARGRQENRLTISRLFVRIVRCHH